jgi:protocatechuate 3,4-dioxygenase beta subunit
MLKKRIGRREAIAVMGAAGAAVAFGCGDSPTSPSTTTTTTPTTSGTTNAACAVTPTETVGPFPSLTDMFRSDIREGKPGTQLTLTVKVVNTNVGCAAVPNANVEIWHVDAAGTTRSTGAAPVRRSCGAFRARTVAVRRHSSRIIRDGIRAGRRTFMSK